MAVSHAGTHGTTVGTTAPSCAPSPRPSASALMCWCMATYVRARHPRNLWMPWVEAMPAQPSAFLQAGKFGIVPTLINTVAAFTSIGVVS